MGAAGRGAGDFDWDDLKVLIAVAEAGTLVGAGRALGLSHTTVLRRLIGAERALGATLFRRRGGVLERTSAGEDVLARARRIQFDIAALARSARAADGELAGTVRLAAPPGLTTDFLIPRLDPFLQAHPRIRVVLHTELSFAAMLLGQADVGVRISIPLIDGLDIRRVCDCRFALYGTSRLARTAARALGRGRPPWPHYVAFNEEFGALPEDRWVRELFRGAHPILHANATTALLAAARAGVGVAALPRYVGDREPGLRRITTPLPSPTQGLFLVTRREQRGVARVRAMVDYLARTFAAERALFLGEASA
jgi:DNA-binding transcriptional LysR family regulator